MAGICPICGAALGDAADCAELFHRMLYLEAEVPGAQGDLPHLFAVGTYQLQHPDRLEPAMLLGLYGGLCGVLSGRMTLEDQRRHIRSVAEGPTRVVRRRQPDAANPPLRPWPERWATTVADICKVAPGDYAAAVRAWANETVAAINEVRRQV